ncbi:uncharacterized protein LOC142825143 isoform X4 [Pelodiscus sinensis]|uniref:uncharacterized protein LOC142825143 isoform X4 n=1 Tax=Pelodiscus sinensis TaxID=13735 RepID=UPI003F6A6AFD
MGARDPCWPLESPWSLPSRTEPPCASPELCQERVDSRVEEGAIYDIEEQLHTRDTSPAALQRFLLAIPLACLAALQRGEDTLAPRCCKDTMMTRIVEIMEDSPPPLVLADCLNAACSLSTLQPPLRAQLLSPLLTAAVGQTVSGDWQQEPIHTQQFIRALPYDLQALLASLLAESPDTARLQLIMEHLSPWLESRLPQERARALGSTTALLGVATTLPGFDASTSTRQRTCGADTTTKKDGSWLTATACGWERSLGSSSQQSRRTAFWTRLCSLPAPPCGAPARPGWSWPTPCMGRPISSWNTWKTPRESSKS